MANWVAITVDNLNNAKVQALVDALRTSALGTGQTDRSTEKISDVVNRIRDEVAACKSNVLDVDETKIPKGLKALAMRFIIWDLKDALELDVTDAEKIQHSDDVAYLRRVASCEIPIATPDDPETTPEVQPAANSPSIVERTHNFTNTTQDGI